MSFIYNYIMTFFRNSVTAELDNKLKEEVLKTFYSDPFEENYQDQNMVYKYIKFIMSIKDKCAKIILITKLQEFRDFRSNNDIVFEDAYKLDKKILGPLYGGRLWTSAYDYPPGVGIFTFN